MSNETTLRIGGPAMILGGVLWSVGNLGHMTMEYFGGIDFDPVWYFAFPPLLIGLYALTVYAGANYPMRAAAWTVLVSGAVAYLGMFVRVLVMFMLPVLLMVLAMLIFGMTAQREKPLPRWNSVALLLVTPLFALIIVIVLSGLVSSETASGIYANVGLTTVFGLIGLCWVLVGCAMLPPRLQTAPAAQP